MNKNNLAPNNVIVSRGLAFRENAQNPEKVFSMKGEKREILFTVIAIAGQRGRPGKADGKKEGFGCRTRVIVRLLNVPRKRTRVYLLSTLLNRPAAYVGLSKNILSR